MVRLNILTPEEKKVIVDKGTEPPFSGEYDALFTAGMYFCRQCDAPLYRSDDKFDAHCGWPSFDDEVPGAITKTPDADGVRTEIMCTRCGAHLGHVFTGENLTPKDTRHCVNSVSLVFIPEEKNDEPHVAVFGGGCFWCTEAVFERLKGVVSVMPGYAGGMRRHPTYEEVSSGTTGHAEVVKIEYDSTVIAYDDLLNVFFSSHDPTSVNRQGNDVGEQYRSVIFFTTLAQKRAAEGYSAALEKEHAYSRPIVTAIEPFSGFYAAEENHRHYYEKNKNAPYCQLVIAPKVEKIKKDFTSLVRTDGEVIL